jgi:hypothetical protein
MAVRCVVWGNDSISLSKMLSIIKARPQSFTIETRSAVMSATTQQDGGACAMELDRHRN